MKKLILIGLVVLSINTKAQIKIGNLTLDDRTAKLYLTDCYTHPDTVRTESEVIGSNYEHVEALNKPIRERNEQLERLAIGQCYDTVHYAAYADTSYDGMHWSSGGDLFKKSGKFIAIHHYAAGIDIKWLGLLIPRKPSEQDFIRWYNQQSK